MTIEYKHKKGFQSFESFTGMNSGAHARYNDQTKFWEVRYDGLNLGDTLTFPAAEAIVLALEVIAKA